MNESVIVEPLDDTTAIMDVQASDIVYRTMPSTSSTSNSGRNDRQTSQPSVIMIDDEETVLPSDDSMSVFTSGSGGATNTNQEHRVSSACNVSTAWPATASPMSSQWATSSLWSASRVGQQPQAASSRLSDQAPEDDDELREALERIRQLEEDERVARQLQAEFDAAFASHQQSGLSHNTPMDIAQPNPNLISAAAYSRPTASVNSYANPMQMHLQLQIAADEVPGASNSAPAPMGTHFMPPAVTSNSNFVMFGPSTSSGAQFTPAVATSMKRSNAAASNHAPPPTSDQRADTTASTTRTRLRATRRSQLPAAQRASSSQVASTSAAVSISYGGDMDAEQSMAAQQRPDAPALPFSTTGQYDAVPLLGWPLGAADPAARTQAQVRADRRRVYSLEQTLEQVVAEVASGSFDPAAQSSSSSSNAAAQAAQPAIRHREYAVARRHRRAAGAVASSSAATDHSNTAASSQMNQFVAATPGPIEAFQMAYQPPDVYLGLVDVSSSPTRRARNEHVAAPPDHAFVVRRGEAGASVMHIPVGLTRTMANTPQWRIELHATPNRMGSSVHAHAHAQAQANYHHSSYSYETLTRLTEALGDVASGLSASRIAQLPTYRYTAPSQNAAQSNGASISTGTATSTESVDTECVICLSQFEQNEELRILTCLHKFHRTCIDPWLFQKGTCPTCRERPSV